MLLPICLAKREDCVTNPTTYTAVAITHITRVYKSDIRPYCWLVVVMHRKIVIAVPTVLAAYNVRNTTIHCILCLPVEHGKPADYINLNKDQLKSVRQTLKGLRLLIIDEVSIISSLTLMFIHLRLIKLRAATHTLEA